FYDFISKNSESRDKIMKSSFESNIFSIIKFSESNTDNIPSIKTQYLNPFMIKTDFLIDWTFYNLNPDLNLDLDLNISFSLNSSTNLNKLKRPKACTNCRKSKIKCIKDDQGQTCKRCKAQGLQCVYEYKVPSYKFATGNGNAQQSSISSSKQQTQQTQHKRQLSHSHSHSHSHQTVSRDHNLNNHSSFLPSISLTNTSVTRSEIPPIKSILNPLNSKTTTNGIHLTNGITSTQAITRFLNPINTNNANEDPILSSLNVSKNNGNKNASHKSNNNNLSNSLVSQKGFNNWENSVEERLEGFGSKLSDILTILQNQQQPIQSQTGSDMEETESKKREMENLENPMNKRQKIIMNTDSAPSSLPESPKSSEDFKEVDITDPVNNLHRILSKEDARELFNFFNSNISPQLFGFDVSSYSIDDIWDTCPLLISTIGCIASIHHPLLSHLSPALEKIIYDISKDILFNIPKTEMEAFNTIVALCFCGFWFKNKQMFTGLAIQLARTMNLISPNSFKSSAKSFIPKKERLKLWYLLYILDGQQTLVFNRQSMFDSNEKSFKKSKEMLSEAESEDNKSIKEIKNIDDYDNDDNEMQDGKQDKSDGTFNANYADIRLISQVEYHQAINAVFDGSAWDLLTPSSFGLPFKTNLELDKWMVQWTVLLSPFNNHPVWSSKSTLIYYNFAKLHINSSAVRKFQAMGTNLPSFDELDDDFFGDLVDSNGVKMNADKKIEEVGVYNDEDNDNDNDDDGDDDDDDDDESFDISKELSPIESRKVSAELALSAAETVLNIVLGDSDILSVLKYVPIHIHIMLYYAALLILKPHSCLSGANQLVDKISDDESRFISSINAIKLVKRLRHSIIVNSPTDKEFSGKIVDGLTSILHDKVKQMKQDIMTGIADAGSRQRRLQMLDKVILDNDAQRVLTELNISSNDVSFTEQDNIIGAQILYATESIHRFESLKVLIKKHEVSFTEYIQNLVNIAIQFENILGDEYKKNRKVSNTIAPIQQKVAEIIDKFNSRINHILNDFLKQLKNLQKIIKEKEYIVLDLKKYSGDNKKLKEKQKLQDKEYKRLFENERKIEETMNKHSKLTDLLKDELPSFLLLSDKIAVGPTRSMSSIFTGANLGKRLRINFVKQQAPITRSFSNWRQENGFKSTNLQIKISNLNKINSVKPIIQQRMATFTQLGRDGYRREEPHYNNVKNNIIKPFIFVTLFTIATYFAMPYVFTYTPLSICKQNPQYLVWGIIGLNAAVFGLWQIRYSSTLIYRSLEKYFIMDRSALTRSSNWSLILSSFSHQEPFHILVNMLCLYSFSGSMISMLGVTGFSSLYLIAGAWSSFFSLAYSQIFRYFGRSLGASGSISGVFTAFATMFPNAGISFFFIPIPGGASVAAGLFALYNVAGCLMRWGSFDYAAHLGGMWVGFLWGMFLKWKVERDEQERRNRLRRLGF
ncbi:hypothetical protein C6P40_005464, partial [Pichia californica]